MEEIEACILMIIYFKVRFMIRILRSTEIEATFLIHLSKPLVYPEFRANYVFRKATGPLLAFLELTRTFVLDYVICKF